MTTVFDCKQFLCDKYYSQCPHCRIARVDKCEVYCEDFNSIDEIVNNERESK